MHLCASKEDLLHNFLLRLFCLKWNSWYGEAWVFKGNCDTEGIGYLILATLSRFFSSFCVWCCWVTTPFIANTARDCGCVGRESLSMGLLMDSDWNGKVCAWGSWLWPSWTPQKIHTLLIWALKIKSSVAAKRHILWVWLMLVWLCYRLGKGYRGFVSPFLPAFDTFRITDGFGL